MAILPAGKSAPDFSLHSTPDHVVSLSEFRGRNMTLAFYPVDWSPVCGDELAPPPLHGEPAAAGRVSLAPATISFFAIENAKNPACH